MKHTNAEARKYQAVNDMLEFVGALPRQVYTGIGRRIVAALILEMVQCGEKHDLTTPMYRRRSGRCTLPRSLLTEGPSAPCIPVGRNL